MREKRLSLTAFALTGEDEECLKVMAETFEEFRTGWMAHIYWDDLVTSKSMTERFCGDTDDVGEPACTIV